MCVSNFWPFLTFYFFPVIFGLFAGESIFSNHFLFGLFGGEVG